MTNTKCNKGGNFVDTTIDIMPTQNFTTSNFFWNCFVYILYYLTVTDEVRSVHDALIRWCRIQDLPVLMLLGAGYKTM